MGTSKILSSIFFSIVFCCRRLVDSSVCKRPSMEKGGSQKGVNRWLYWSLLYAFFSQIGWVYKMRLLLVGARRNKKSLRRQRQRRKNELVDTVFIQLSDNCQYP